MEEEKRDRQLETIKRLLVALRAALVVLVKFLAVLVLAVVVVVVRVLPVALRLACVGVEVCAAYVAFGRVFTVYGSDVTGALLAGLVVIVPLVCVLTMGGGLPLGRDRGQDLEQIEFNLWGSLVGAASITYLAGMAAPVLPPSARALVVAGALGAVVLYFIGGKTKDEQESG